MGATSKLSLSTSYRLFFCPIQVT